MKVINYTALKKNRRQYLQAKSRRKTPQAHFQKHQIQETFEFFWCRDPSGNVKKTKQFKKKLNFAWIKFRGWSHFSVFRVDLISRFLSETAKFYPREI